MRPYPHNKQRLDFHTAENATVPHISIYARPDCPIIEIGMSPADETSRVEAFAIKLMHVADNTRPATVMLSLCTSHMPEPCPYFDKLRHAECGDISTSWAGGLGYVVWVQHGLTDEEIKERVPEWLRPAWKEAKACGARLIEFDQAAPTYEYLPRWVW